MHFLFTNLNKAKAKNKFKYKKRPGDKMSNLQKSLLFKNFNLFKAIH